MTKIDLRKELKHLYHPSAKAPVLVEVPPMNFLMVDGKGDPNTSQKFREAMEAAYGLSFTLKFMLKKDLGIDYTVLGIEGLWWTEEGNQLDPNRKRDWLWTLLAPQPDFVTLEQVERVIELVKARRNPPALERVRFERFHEGLSAQIMHLGPYNAEGPTIAKLHQFIHDKGYSLHGKHHEVYLSDPRRCAPEKMKTVLRQPVG